MSQEENLIDAANKAAARLEEANKINLELLRRAEALDARRILGGYSEAGNKAPEVSEEEKIKIDMKNYFKGTALEKVFK